MHIIEQIDQALAPERERLVTSSTFQHLLGSTITRAGYAELLRTIYHHVRHTPSRLALASWRCDPRQSALRDALLYRSRDVAGFHPWIEDDLYALGETDPPNVVEAPSAASAALVGYGYYVAGQEHPAATLTERYFVDGLFMELDSRLARAVGGPTAVSSEATSFLTHRAAVARDQLAETVELMRVVVDEAGRSAALRCAAAIAWSYGAAYAVVDPRAEAASLAEAA